MKTKIKLTAEQLKGIIAEKTTLLEGLKAKELETLNKLHAKAEEQLNSKYTKLIGELPKKFEYYEVDFKDDDEIPGTVKVQQRKSWKEDIKKLLELKAKGVKGKELAKQLGRTTGSINQQLNKMKKEGKVKKGNKK